MKVTLPLYADRVYEQPIISKKCHTKAKIGMVQINNSFSGQNYLPLSIGFLQSYAASNMSNYDDFEFLVPIYKRISINDAVRSLIEADLVAFSVYVWNFNISCRIAQRLKEEKPDIVIAFGGCHVPENNLESFLRNNPYIDIASIGEGERSFVSILNHLSDYAWEHVPSLGFIDKYENFVQTPTAPRIEDLNEIPSPFLNGVFDKLIDLNKDEKWIGLWETNRGCPFKCFAEDTKIITSRCPNKRAKDIQVDDFLMCMDEESNEITETRVTHVFSRMAKDLLKISFSDGTILKVTSEHPFYINGKWIEANSLQTGDEIFDIKPNDKISFNKKVNNPAKREEARNKISSTGKMIINIERLEKEYRVVNFSCSPHQSYFANYVLSHNCTFCDWGVGSKNRMANYDIDRLYKEIDWFSHNKIEFIYCCDANFGMYKDRDLAIVEKCSDNKERFGYPHAMSVQNTKNSTQASYEIQKKLSQSGLSKGVLLAFQSLNEETLVAIKRSNIKLDTFYDLQQRFSDEGVQTFSDIIIGLPKETYHSFVNGVCQLIEMGQHNRIQFNNLSILPNAEMASEDYVNKYGLGLVDTDLINIHGYLDEWKDNAPETQKLVVYTDSMPKEDWVRARSFASMVALLHFNKLTQIPNIILNFYMNIPYNEIIDSIMGSDLPILSEISSFFIQKAQDIQNGDAEYCKSKEWLNIWWPADEYIMIKLVREEKLDQFYEEMSQIIKGLLYKKSLDDYDELLYESIILNRNLLKVPFCFEDQIMSFSYNIWEIYKSALLNRKSSILKGEYSYKIERRSESWSNWEDWYREVVWYANKKGAYMYSCVEES